MKRPITPHKGGRNATFPNSRLSPEERGKLDRILAHMGISAADWVAPKIHDDYRMIFGDEPQSAVQDEKQNVKAVG